MDEAIGAGQLATVCVQSTTCGGEKKIRRCHHQWVDSIASQQIQWIFYGFLFLLRGGEEGGYILGLSRAQFLWRQENQEENAQ